MKIEWEWSDEREQWLGMASIFHMGVNGEYWAPCEICCIKKSHDGYYAQLRDLGPLRTRATVEHAKDDAERFYDKDRRRFPEEAPAGAPE